MSFTVNQTSEHALEPSKTNVLWKHLGRHCISLWSQNIFKCSPGQSGLIQPHPRNDARPMQEGKGQRGEWAVVGQGIQLKHIKGPVVHTGKAGRHLRRRQGHRTTPVGQYLCLFVIKTLLMASSMIMRTITQPINWSARLDRCGQVWTGVDRCGQVRTTTHRVWHCPAEGHNSPGLALPY